MRADNRAPSRAARAAWPAAVGLVTALLALVPLVGSSDFYLRSDTTVQYAPTWFHLGEMVRSGAWPPTLDPDVWVGGNYAAEGLFGIYNPLNLLIWLGVSFAGDLGTAVLLVKVTTLVVLALGCYFLFREYAAAPWAAATVAVAIPWAGFTHYFDAGAFPAGLMAFAYTPWIWWAFRRTMRGSLNPFWAFLLGALAVTQGNPYGTLAVVVLGLGVLCEGLVTRNLAGVTRLAMTGACVAAFLPLVYLPLLETAEVAVRAERPFLSDTGRLSPDPWELLVAANPGFVPDMVCGNIDCELPTVYLCWFLVPLLPWLDFGALRHRVREYASAAVVAALYLAAMLGPSELWFFRWPIRVSGYFLLALAVPVAVMLSHGLRTDRKRLRLLVTGALVAATVGLGLGLGSEEYQGATATGAVLLAVLTLILAGGHAMRSWPPRTVAAVLLAGTSVVLLWQSLEFRENTNLRDWPVTTDVGTLQSRYGDLNGRVLQLADLGRYQDHEQTERSGAADRSFLPGSMFQPAGVEAVNSYSGMGFLSFQKYLCMHYEGSTDACGLERLWTPLAPGEPHLADLMKLDAVLVQSSQAAGFTPPTGWQVAPRGEEALLVERTRPKDYAGSRLAWASAGVSVQSARTIDDHHESVQLGTSGSGRLVFALLAWPGYEAELDGRPVEVTSNEAGLLTVELPRGAEGELELSYTPPGLTLSLWSAALGLVGAVVLGGWSRRRTTSSPDAGTLRARQSPVSPPG